MQNAVFNIEEYQNEIITVYPEPPHIRKQRIQIEQQRRTINYQEHRKHTTYYSQLQTEHFKDTLTGFILILTGVFFIALGWITGVTELYLLAVVYAIIMTSLMLAGGEKN